MRARVGKFRKVIGEDSAKGFFALVFMIMVICGLIFGAVVGMTALFALSAVAGWLAVLALVVLWFWWLTS